MGARGGIGGARIWVAAAAITASGCVPPPDAPEDFEELVVYLFAQHRAGDPALAAGIDNLVAWIEEQDEVESSYSIGPLDEETVDGLDERDRTAEGAIGAAVLTRSDHPALRAAEVHVTVPPTEVYGDDYSDFSREDLDDVACFLARDCDRLRAEERYTGHFVFGMTSRQHVFNEYAWTGDRPAYVHRNWQVEPPEVSDAVLEIVEQYYLSLFVPAEQGHHRLQATWLVNGDAAADDDITLNQTAATLRRGSEDLEAWLDAEYGDPDGG